MKNATEITQSTPYVLYSVLSIIFPICFTICVCRVCRKLFYWIIAENNLHISGPFLPSYFSMYFQKKDIFLHNHRSTIKIRMLTRKQYYYLITQFTDHRQTLPIVWLPSFVERRHLFLWPRIQSGITQGASPLSCPVLSVPSDQEQGRVFPSSPHNLDMTLHRPFIFQCPSIWVSVVCSWLYLGHVVLAGINTTKEM